MTLFIRTKRNCVPDANVPRFVAWAPELSGSINGRGRTEDEAVGSLLSALTLAGFVDVAIVRSQSARLPVRQSIVSKPRALAMMKGVPA